MVDSHELEYPGEKAIQSVKSKQGKYRKDSMISGEKIDVLYRVVIADKDRQAVMRVAVDMKPAEAKRASDNMRVLLICNLTDHPVRKAIIDGPVSRYSNILKVDLKK